MKRWRVSGTLPVLGYVERDFDDPEEARIAAQELSSIADGGFVVTTIEEASK